MKVYTLSRQQTLPRPLSEVFAFFQNPENLGQLTPAELRFQILTPPPLVMRQGTVLDYLIHIWGIPVRWRTLITGFDPPHEFVDEQLQGPYDFWHHTHTFTASVDGTLIEDKVHYTMPFGLLGRLVHSLFVRRQLETIFAYRAQAIARWFDSQGAG